MFLLLFRRRYLFQNFLNVKKFNGANCAVQLLCARLDHGSKFTIDKDGQPKNAQGGGDNDMTKEYCLNVLGLRPDANIQQVNASYQSYMKAFNPELHRTAKDKQIFEDIKIAYQHLIKDPSLYKMKQDLLTQRDSSRDPRLLKVLMDTKKSSPKNSQESKNCLAANDLIFFTNSNPLLDLKFIEAALGTKKIFDIRFSKKCHICNGKSAKNRNADICPYCNGTGDLIRTMGNQYCTVACEYCDGRTIISTNPCEACQNRGSFVDIIRIPIMVPPGTKTGDIIESQHPLTKQRIYFRAIVEPSDYYRRIGNDLYTDKYISIAEAVLGGMIKVRGIFEELIIHLKPGTESHEKFVFANMGIKTPQAVGDHIVTLKIRVPSKLTPKQRQLMLAFGKTEEEMAGFDENNMD